ncbi:MAG: bifunctional nuclease family protein [Candidatus Buchananbacteria bacterium]
MRVTRDGITYYTARISGVGVIEDSGRFLVTMASGETDLVLVVNRFEATAIRLALDCNKPPRPLIHDLVAKTMVGSSTRAEVLISELVDGTFIGQLIYSEPEKETLTRIDCRPGDAIAVALRVVGCQILVTEEVLQHADGLIVAMLEEASADQCAGCGAKEEQP